MTEGASTTVLANMETAFGEVQTTALSALGTIGVIAIALFAGVYAWRYGKKVFSIIAK